MEHAVKYEKLHHWKYRLYETYSIKTGVTGYAFKTRWLAMAPDGTLTLLEGYCWDGASGAIDTPDIMRGSLVHDGLYQCIRIGLLPPRHKDDADRLLREICIADGMPPIRAEWVYWAVHLAGWPSILPSAEPEHRIYDTEVLCKRLSLQPLPL